MIENGLITISLKTVDSDVVVILVGLFYKIADQVDDIWVEYGAGKHLQYISIRIIYNQLGEFKAKAIFFSADLLCTELCKCKCVQGHTVVNQ